jgi:diguanylate cyclase (GGDEF)-like protein/putative nucleotidyltransferase with HDIG domain
MSDLSKSARFYVLATALFGLACLAYSVKTWSPIPWGEFVWYLACAVASSKLKVTLPGMTGTLSVNFVFILIAITELDLAATVAIACASGVAQAILTAKARPQPVQLAFTLTSMAGSSTLAHLVYHSALVHRQVSSVPFLLCLCALVYFLANTWSVGGIIALTERKPFWRLWMDRLFWTAPNYLAGAAIAALHHGLVRGFGWQNSVLVLPVVYLIYRSYRLYLDRLEEEKRHVSEVASLHLRTIKALALAIDAKDGTTSDHLRRVQVYAMGLAKEMDLDEPETRALEAASLLHDIGKLAVPEHIISKPGRLTPEEFKKMQIHPVVGAEILATVDFPYPVVPIVRAHHERWDGSGYPHGLKGEQIPMGARILAAVDCLDALASDRQYRRALPLDEAMAKVASEAGTGYDPAVIRVLQRRYLELEALARTSNGAKLANRNVSGRQTAPQAGFETASLDNTPGEAQPIEFIASIAAARQEFHMLLEIATGLGSSLCVDDTLSLLARKLQNAIPYHAIAIYIVKDAKLAPQFAEGENSELFGSLEIPLGQGLSGWVAENRKAIINGNPSVEPGYLKDPARFSTLRSALSVPLPGMDGIVGVLTLYHRQAAAFTADHLRILMAVSTKAGLTIENALRYKHAEKSATMDELTLLPNARSLFLHLDAELARCRRTSAELAVMVLDLDGFKEVNDRFGHLTGNRVLKAAAQGIREICRDYDYVARMGGDEFVVLMPGLNRENMPARKIDLHEVVSRTGREICGEEILSVSVGEAFFPADGNDAEQLLTEADRRMYQMKHIHHAQRRARPVLSEPLELQRTEAGGTDVGLAGERRS